MSEIKNYCSLVDTATAAKMLAVSKSHLEKIRIHDPSAAPPTVRIGKCVRYPVDALRAWIGQQAESPR